MISYNAYRRDGASEIVQGRWQITTSSEPDATHSSRVMLKSSTRRQGPSQLYTSHYKTPRHIKLLECIPLFTSNHGRHRPEEPFEHARNTENTESKDRFALWGLSFFALTFLGFGFAFAVTVFFVFLAPVLALVLGLVADLVLGLVLDATASVFELASAG